MTKYTGEDLVIIFDGTNISGQGRTLEISQSSDDIDVTAYGSGDKEFIVGMQERSATVEILDEEESPAIRLALVPGSSGTLAWFPEGEGSGQPSFEAEAFVMEQNLSYPYDDVVMLNVTMKLSDALEEGVAEGDIDGGESETMSFDDTIDGGFSDTVVYDDIVDGGGV